MNVPRSSRVNQPLAIVGASTRAAAASAVRAGFQPLAADLFADADLRHIATATRMSPYPDGVHRLDANRRAARLDVHRSARKPSRAGRSIGLDRAALGQRGRRADPRALTVGTIGCTRCGRPIVSGNSNFPRWFAPRWLVVGENLRRRERQRRTSCGTTNAEQGSRNLSHVIRSESKVCPAPPCSLRRMRGPNCSASRGSLSAKLAGLARLPIRRVDRSLAPLAKPARASIERLGNILAKHFELIGLFGVDFILDGDSVWTLEVNPRYTASVEIVERFTGTNAIPRARLGVRRRAGPRVAADKSEQNSARRAVKRFYLLAANSSFHRVSLKGRLELALEEPWPSLADVSTAGTADRSRAANSHALRRRRAVSNKWNASCIGGCVDLENEIYAPS